MSSHEMIVTRRGFVSTSCRILTAALAGAVAPIGPAFAQVRKDGTNDRAARDADRLILLGTQGGPNYLPQRSESGNALVVDGVTYLIDCGYGTLGALIEAGLDYLEIANVFLTHLHDDHTSDLAALLSHQWTTGRIEPTTVHGPHGTRALVELARGADVLVCETIEVDAMRRAFET